MTRILDLFLDVFAPQLASVDGGRFAEFGVGGVLGARFLVDGRADLLGIGCWCWQEEGVLSNLVVAREALLEE